MTLQRVLLIAPLILLLAACDSDADSGPPDAAEPPACTDDHRPVVLVHGLLASGDTWALQSLRFQSNGYCPHRLVTFDYNTLEQSLDHASALDGVVDQVLAETGADQVDLAGHSMGGALSYEYLATPDRAAKVAHYAHVGSTPQSGPAGDASQIPTLNIWSPDDTIIEDASDVPGAVNLRLPGKDHYAVATCAEAFSALYAHFNGGQAPATDAVTPQTEGVLLLSGKAVALGENTPAEGWLVDVYEVSDDAGERLSAAPLNTFEVTASGWWGYFPAKPDTYYELHLHAGPGATEEDIPVHYYVEPFVRTNRHVYLRKLPSENSLPGLLLGSIPFTEDAAVLVNFTQSTAILHPTDSLTVNGVELATAELASAESTTIAMFLYDDNRNGLSDESPIPLFSSLPFLRGMDLYFPAVPGETISVRFNGRGLNAPPWPSATDGVIITVFE